jgi:hypothetical protein
MKKLTGLQWHLRNITELGCIKGCLDYLGKEISFPWLYGGTCYAFVINIQKELDPSGDSCWDTQPIFDLAPNLGYKVTGISIEKAAAGNTYPEMQRQAWDFVRENLDHGIPCYGWEVDPYIPGYNVINGYEEDDASGKGGGYFYSGWSSGGPRDWRTLGDTDVPVLQVRRVELVNPAADIQVIKDALSVVLKHSATADGWYSHPDYASGPAAYNLWADSVENGLAIRDGHSYAAATWLECREMAVEFMKEVKQKLPGRCDEVIDQAIHHYSEVCDQLHATLALNPFNLETWDPVTKLQNTEAAALLRQAGIAESKGLAALQTIVDRLLA